MQLFKKDKEIEGLRHELKAMSIKLNGLTEDHKLCVEELRSEAASNVEILRAEIQVGSEALSQENGAFKMRLDKNMKQMNAALRQKIDSVNKAKDTDIANLSEDIITLREKQEQDRTELKRQATGLRHLHKHGVVPADIVMPDFARHKAAADKMV